MAKSIATPVDMLDMERFMIQVANLPQIPNRGSTCLKFFCAYKFDVVMVVPIVSLLDEMLTTLTSPVMCGEI